MSEEVALAPEAELGAEAVGLLQRLIRIDTSNPPGNEGEAGEGEGGGGGALDMKGQVAAEVAAAVSLARGGWRPGSGDLLVVVTADEERGAAYGARGLCEERPELVRSDLV